MMLSVLVWIAMWGQVQTPNCELLKSGHVLCSDFRLVKPPKPAEHVIEIKTVRKKREVSRTSDIWPGSHEHAKCNKGEGAVNDYVTFLIGVGAVGVTTIQYCESQSRELWIDGVKFGVIKGLDDH